MKILRSLILFSSLIVLVIAHSQDAEYNNFLQEYKAAEKVYREAENDLPEEKEIELNTRALKLFRDLALRIEKEKKPYDSISFQSYYRIGVLEHYFENYVSAEKAYKRAIETAAKINSFPDSLLFQPYLYLGIVQYYDTKLDSAIVAYKKAEAITEKYGGRLSETERLYNTLGTIYYETGNYRQAKNYMEKSISMLPKSHASYEDLMVNFKINLASVLMKLEEYEQAISIYESLMKYGVHRDVILHNTGVINLNLGSIDKAIGFFRRVDPAKTNRARLYNDMALAFYNKRNYDSATAYLRMSASARTSNVKSVPYGQTLKIKGDLLAAENKWLPAINKYQEAIIQFYSDFDEKDIYRNPLSFGGVFSYINLFHTLSAKAVAFEELYATDKRLESLKASLEAYRSAFRLADYVEKSYDSDEARLFLNKIKYLVHSRPIDVSLLLYDLTKEEEYLETAYLFDQYNKGSVITLGIQENELERRSGVSSELLHEEASLRSSITRLSLKANQVTDPKQLDELKMSLLDQEIRLSKVQEEIDRSATRSSSPIVRIPGVADVKAQLDRHTALLSYHLSEKELLILCFTGSELSYKKVPINVSFFNDIRDHIEGMMGTEPVLNNRSLELYKKLISPVHGKLSGKKRLILIPDDELNSLPFETLKNEDGDYLLEEFAVQYEYAASLLKAKSNNSKKYEVLGMAPFVDQDFTDMNEVQTFQQLKYSGEEIRDLKGKILFNANATREQFIQQANRYPVIHLATHAMVNDKAPERSFIAFSPKKDTLSEFRLYAGEIYNLDLDSTRLIILSACETGAGELVKGEGLMSLSRAFAYAGCPNIVTSLWKAEDRTTAFITERMHHYLQKGDPTDISLQKAKLDLLKSTTIDPRLKSPNYWGHLIFIGSYEPQRTTSPLLWIIGGIVVLGVVLYFFLRNPNGAK